MNKKIEQTEKPIIEACLQSAHDLLTHYWPDITKIRDAKDNFVSVAISFKVDTTGDSPLVKTKIGFSRRFGDMQELVVDTNQTEFTFLKDLSYEILRPTSTNFPDGLDGISSISVADTPI